MYVCTDFVSELMAVAMGGLFFVLFFQTRKYIDEKHCIYMEPS